jgi:hypothetical protein
MTGNIVFDFFLGLAYASIGGAITYAAWRLVTYKPTHQPH